MDPEQTKSAESPPIDQIKKILRDFVKSNRESLFELLHLKGPAEYQGVSVSNKREFCEKMSEWIQSGNVGKVTQVIAYCAWKTRGVEMRLTGTFRLHQALSFSCEVNFCLLKSLFYIYRPYINSKPSSIPESARLTFKHVKSTLQVYSTAICLECNGISKTPPFHIEDSLRMSCYFLILSLFPNKVPVSLNSQMQDFFEEACMKADLSEDYLTAVLCLCSVRLRSIRSPVSSEFTVNCQLSVIQLELMLDCLGKYQLIPDLLLSQMLFRIASIQCQVHDTALIAFLSPGQRAHIFIRYFQSAELATMKQVLFLLSLLNSADLANALDEIPISHMDMETWRNLNPTLEQLFEKQFSNNTISQRFSKRYLRKLIKLSSSGEAAIKSTLMKLAIFGTSSEESRPLGCKMLLKYITNLIKAEKDGHILTTDICRAIMRIEQQYQELRDELKVLIETAISDINVTMVHKTEEDKCISNGFYHLLQEMLKIEVPETHSIPEELLRTIKNYSDHITEYIVNPGFGFDRFDEFITYISLMCGTTSYRQVHFEDLKTLKSIQELFFSFLIANLEQLKAEISALLSSTPENLQQATEAFTDLWSNHLTLVQSLFRSPLIISLAFTDHKNYILRVFALSEIIGVFDDMHPFTLEDTAQMRYTHIARLIQRAYFTNFTQANEFETHQFIAVITSPCLKEALNSMQLNTTGLGYFADRILFTDMGSDCFGVSLIGGYIILNSRYRGGEQKDVCTLVITLAHELAHMARRQVSEPDSPASEGTKRTGLFTYAKKSPNCKSTEGMPGENRNPSRIATEGGYTLEETLFGCVITRLTDSQIEFLCNASSWRLELSDFKNTLSGLRHSTNGHRVRYMKRSSGGITPFDRVQSCGFHPFSS